MSGSASTDLAAAKVMEQMTDKRARQTFDQLWLFIGAKVTEGRWIFRFEADTGRRLAGPAAKTSPTCRLPGFRRRSGCVPAEPYPPLKQPETTEVGPTGNGSNALFRF